MNSNCVDGFENIHVEVQYIKNDLFGCGENGSHEDETLE